MRLGLVLPPAGSGMSSAPVPTLAARAGWPMVWAEASEASSVRYEGIMLAGVVLPGQRPPMAAEVWLRGERGAAFDATVAMLRRRRRPPALSVDAPDAASLTAAMTLGARPVLGPAPLAELLSAAARWFDLGGGRSRPTVAEGVAITMPASPGRTLAEARARLDRDPALRAMADGAADLVGPLEACQDVVIALSQAGVVDLRLRVPATPDLADVLAQLAVLGAPDLTRVQPGRRSAPPPPPSGWGGRS